MAPRSKSPPDSLKRSKAVPAKNARGRRKSHAARLADPILGAAAGSASRRGKAEDVRGRIIEAALECFGAFGFAGTSTRAVAERAGTSHPLLIYHFQSKEQLWLTTMEEVIGRYQSALLARFASVPTDDPIAGLRAFIENFVDFSAQTPELHRIMTQQSTQRSDRLDWLLDTYLKQSFKKVCDLIRAGQKARQVRAGDPARIYYAVIGLAGTLFSVSREFRLLTKRDVFAPEEVRATIEMIFEFLFTEGAR